MHKFLGILFFYTLAFNEKGFDRRTLSYLQEKSERYLGIKISKDQWKLLVRSNLRYTNMESDPLSEEDIINVLEAFDDVFGIGNIEFEYRMYGIPEEEERKIMEECFDDLSQYIEILCSSCGVSIVFGDWLSKSKLSRGLIERFMNRVENIDHILNN